MPRVDRLTIGIFGRVNAGKSTLMNVLTQQNTSIVDATPGTTTDIKASLMEVHALGPVKILDTAGLDEGRELGSKKRDKTLAALERVDVALLVVDPVEIVRSGKLDVEQLVAQACRGRGKTLILVCNVSAERVAELATLGASVEQAVEHCRSILADPQRPPVLVADLDNEKPLRALVDLIAQSRPDGPARVQLLPFVTGQGSVLLHIPLDELSPSGRLLRPQEMALEYLLRLGVPVALARVDLRLARSGSTVVSGRERDKFLRLFDRLGGADEVQLVLTDSQAIDVMAQWLPPHVALTTFSVMMIHHTSEGQLGLFAEGARVLDTLRSGDRVLIAEACNHDRMKEDIGTVQIPRKLEQIVPGIVVEHTFGREFPEPEELRRYALVVHCGGCMISKQHASARVMRLKEAGVPVSNYGMVLSWFEGRDILERVLRPWAGLCNLEAGITLNASHDDLPKACSGHRG